MLVFKCKMCGGELTISQEMTVCECQYCGTNQTLPKLNDEKKKNLYDRAGHFRRKNEYDKAMAIYEQILNENLEDAESYWSLVLCRYGVEYVEDPVTHKRVPTVNRTQFTSVFLDDNYKAAIKYADTMQKSIYEADAKEIDDIHKRILAISNKEEPFDVFICYKETDDSGRRTQDSVLATELYHQLTKEGFKVFFARITLEDKIGTAYEPYIFAALNSAKVMVVLGTKPEYFNSVWVKNEWNRYLTLIKGDTNKILIPAYKDMEPYDLPEELSFLQALDMSKLGFMQDLIYSIKKIIGKSELKIETKHEIVSKELLLSQMVERMFILLEDGKFERAEDLCGNILSKDNSNAYAYLGKLMVRWKVNYKEEFANIDEPLDLCMEYDEVMKYADSSLKKELEDYNQKIRNRIKLRNDKSNPEKIINKEEERRSFMLMLPVNNNFSKSYTYEPVKQEKKPKYEKPQKQEKDISGIITIIVIAIIVLIFVLDFLRFI